MIQWVLSRVSANLERMQRFHRMLVWTVQVLVFALCGLFAFLLRFDMVIPAVEISYLYAGIAVWVVVKILVFAAGRQSWWRYVSVHDVAYLIGINALASTISCVAILLISPPGFPRSLYLLDFVLCLLATMGMRIGTRIIYDSVRAHRHQTPKKSVLIYGAGSAGVALARELRSNPTVTYSLTGFIDADARMHNTIIQGAPVLGGPADVQHVVQRHDIDEVLIALPHATSAQMDEVLRICREAEVPCRTIPAMAEIIEGRSLAKQIRDIDVADLLARNPVSLDEASIRHNLTGKRVLVTGAAGSIGSEICRQIARFHPAILVGYESSENGLFHLENEMRTHFPGLPFVPQMGNIQNKQRLAETFAAFQPNIVFHAAAYKHVPMMEMHVVEAVENNILGTHNVAEAAAEFGADEFVLISSDKAVRPTSMMGATKRVAELAVKSLANAKGPRFVSVRFGNVLGSNGSVIPTFKKQIADGGPVTVTDPEMRRFFMTIPEAAQLVLQAAAMGEGGEIFVLEMGEPVKIVDLARKLISLSGYTVDKDIAIKFVGARPGEKLYEELSGNDEDTRPTCHHKVRVMTSNWRDPDFPAVIKEFEWYCKRRSAPDAINLIQRLVPDYTPSESVIKQAEQLQKIGTGGA